MRSREARVLVSLLLVLYAVSGWQPVDRPTWWMEVAPVFLAAPVLVWLDRFVGFTPLVVRLLAGEAVLVAIGAHYTYANVPLGFWVSDLLDLERNHYDRFGHFLQGAVPAMLLRELLLKTSPMVRGKWLFATVSAFCLAFSAFYEFVEWWAAVAFADGATEFLGTQGDPWDSQWDMFLAFCGSVVAQLVFAGPHDRQLRGREGAPSRSVG